MTWKSRIDKQPPPKFFAEVVAYLDRAYPGATVTRELMQQLRPLFVQGWREGKNAKGVAEATCGCDGKTIVPSPATAQILLKGEVRAPQGAQRGQVFGAEDLRESAPIWRLRSSLETAKARAQRAQEKASRAEEAARRARAASSQASASKRHMDALAEYREALEQAERIERELSRLLTAQETERARLARETEAAAQRLAASAPASVPARAPRTPKAKAAPTTQAKRGSGAPEPTRKPGAALPAPPAALRAAVGKTFKPEDF